MDQACSVKIAGFVTCTSPIIHLICPPKCCITFQGCFLFLLDITAVPRQIENNAYAKFWGTNKVHYGGSASGVYWRRSFVHWPRLRIGKHNARLATSLSLISS